MAGKTQGDLEESAGKLVGGLDKPETDSLDDVASPDTPSYGGGGSPSYGGSGGDTGSSGSGGDEDTGTDGDDSGSNSDADSDYAAEADSDDDDAGSDGDWAGGEENDGEDGDGDAEPEFETQPDQHQTGNDDGSGGGSGDDTPGDGRVSMDIQAMTMLIAAMERARDQIPEYQAEFRKILTDVELVEYAPMEGGNRLSDVVGWIEDELPGLRRRLALAQALEDGDGLRTLPDRAPRERTPVTYDEGQVPDHPPHVSVEHGQAAVSLFTTQPDHRQVRDLIATLKGNQHDPYFAREFVNGTDPETVAATVEAARSRDDVDPARVDELNQLLTSTVRTARRGTGDLAPEEGFDDQWAQFS